MTKENWRYPQGPVSVEFKDLLKERIKNATDESKLKDILNGIHDAVLVCRNDPDGLREQRSNDSKNKVGL